MPKSLSPAAWASLGVLPPVKVCRKGKLLSRKMLLNISVKVKKKETGSVNRKISISEVQTHSENPSMPTAAPTLITCTSEICKKQITWQPGYLTISQIKACIVRVEQGYNKDRLKNSPLPRCPFRVPHRSGYAR